MSFIVSARLTPLSITADKLVAAQVYTTKDDTSVGDEESQHILGLATSLTGGTDTFEACCGAIKAVNGIYLEVLENGAGSDSDSALFTISYVPALDFVGAYPSVGIWRAQHWEEAPGRTGTVLGSNYYAEINITDGEEDAADGTEVSGAGGQRLEADSNRSFLTDEMLSTLRTGTRE